MTVRPLTLVLAACALAVSPARAADVFESQVRPLLIQRCIGCHGPEKAKGGLRLDSAAGLAKGGESGPAVVAGKPDESLLIRAVQHRGPKMPPDGRLKETEIAALSAWIKAGAIWPKGSGTPSVTPSVGPRAVAADDSSLKPALQAWYRADRLTLADGKPVPVWPDASGRGRDLSATAGVRKGGVGTAPTFAAAGTVNRRPAVRFDVGNGLATSPDLPVPIRGDAGFTIVVVMNLRKHDAKPPYDGVVGIGNPAYPGNPGRPLAALIQIERTRAAELQLAGGWNHNATLGPGSFEPYFDRPIVLTAIKSPGPIRATTRIYVNGIEAGRMGGTDTVPDIQHRDDIGVYLGKALDWCGHIRGDVSEVIVYNRPLVEADRVALELNLADRFGLLHPAAAVAARAEFTPEQKAFWSFQPVRRPTLPSVRDERWIRTPVDRFVLAGLEKAGVTPAPQADRRTLLRRVTFDLIGLPPTPTEIDAFVNDPSPDAYAKVVDRLLRSPHYGERWARHWLDVVRYAETTANDANAVMRYAWRYRDYVVRAFNADLPYDRFVVEQLAGDLLPPDKARGHDPVIATGLLMVGAKALAETDKEQTRLDVVDDQIDVVGRAFLGLTVSCARCHDHKFDPIPTVDYYAFAGIFRSTEAFRDEVRNASMWQEFPLPTGDVVMAPREGMPVNLRVHLRGDRHTLGRTAPRGPIQIVGGLGHAFATVNSGRLELARWIADAKNPLTPRVMVNRLWQHHFGTGLVATADNFGTRGERPSHPELLDWLADEFVQSGWSLKSLHRTMVLSNTYQQAMAVDAARDPANRLLGRANRRRLDAEAMRDAMLAVAGRLNRAVGGNESGELLYGEGEVIDKNRDFFRPNRVQADHPVYTTSTRRSLYLPVVRNAVPDVLALFDGADPNGVTAIRNDTTVASQGLFLLNHPFVRDQAKHFATQLLNDSSATDGEHVRQAYRLALGREPRPAEVSAATAYLAKYAERVKGPGGRLAAWQSYCQTLLCRNEFLYVD